MGLIPFSMESDDVCLGIEATAAVSKREGINVQYLCKMSDGHLNFQWTFQLVHWTNGHLDVQ